MGMRGKARIMAGRRSQPEKFLEPFQWIRENTKTE
jgi:hypothetical protein